MSRIMPWGGKRDRAGRKKIDPDLLRVQVGATVSKETRQWLKDLQDKWDLSFGEVLDRLREEFLKENKD